MSADGSIIIGYEPPGDTPLPVMWTLSGGQFQKQNLNLPAGHTGALPNGISADGQIIVGESYIGGITTKAHALYWQNGNPTPILLEPACTKTTTRCTNGYG
jgi:probable HAF family extracellular repeat protein